MIKVTVRLNDADGEVLGTAQHPTHRGADWALEVLDIGGKSYVVTGIAESPGRDTLYVQPVGTPPSGLPS